MGTRPHLIDERQYNVAQTHFAMELYCRSSIRYDSQMDLPATELSVILRAGLRAVNYLDNGS